MKGSTRQGWFLGAVLLTVLLVGSLMVCHEAMAGPKGIRVVGTFLDSKADPQGEDTVLFSYKRKKYPFKVKDVTFMSPRVVDKMGTLLRVGRSTIVVFGGDSAVAAIKPEEMVGTTYILEGQLYVADGILQIYHSEVLTE